MQKFLETLKRWGSINPRKRPHNPYGDMMERTVAWSIDLALIYSLLHRLFDLVAMQVYRHHDLVTLEAAKRANFTQLWDAGELAVNSGEWGHLIGSPALHLYLTDLISEFFLLGVLVIGAQWLYGNTPGKWLLGLKIVKRTSLAPVARWQYVLRYLAYIPSVGIFMLGVILSHFNRERRTLHDIIAGTVVLQTRGQGWYWNKLKQGFAWIKNKIRPAAPPANDNSNTPA